MTNLITVQDMKVLAQAGAASGMFGFKKVEDALALMALAQAEGLHPAAAFRDYHVISGRPALKADAMLARFQKSGGKVNWIKYTDEICEATFSHPQGGEITVAWDKARAKQAELGSANWKKYPRQMLRARVISEAIRTVFPGVLSGMYTEEEVEDMPVPKIIESTAIEVPDYTSIGKSIVERIKSAETADALSDIVDEQTNTLDAMQNEAPAIYARVKQRIDEAQEKLKVTE